MNKEHLLEELRAAAALKLLTKEEVLEALNDGSKSVENLNDSEKESGARGRHVTVSTVLYYIGAAIVFLGIFTLVYQNWDGFSLSVKLILTFGSAVSAYVMGYLFGKYKNLVEVGDAFYFISGMLAPIAMYVLFDIAHVDTNSPKATLSIFAILFAVFLSSYYLRQRVVFMIFGVLFGTAVFHSLLELLMSGNQQIGAHVYEYEALVIGLSYLLLGYDFSIGGITKSKPLEALSGSMYGIGSVIFLGSALSLGGWSPNSNAFWELIFPVLVFAVIFSSVYLKSRALLVFGSLFLIAYILKLTAEYFTSGFGWPLALVIAGLTIIGTGYFAFWLNKKYFKTAS